VLIGEWPISNVIAILFFIFLLFDWLQIIGSGINGKFFCYFCGYHNSELTLKDREWKCPDCKTKYDKYITAAINIYKFVIIDQNLIWIWHPWNAWRWALRLVLTRERKEQKSHLVFSWVLAQIIALFKLNLINILIIILSNCCWWSAKPSIS